MLNNTVKASKTRAAKTRVPTFAKEGAPKRPVGRPPISGEAGERWQVHLPPAIEVQLRKLGRGSLSRGIVKAAEDLSRSA